MINQSNRPYNQNKNLQISVQKFVSLSHALAIP